MTAPVLIRSRNYLPFVTTSVHPGFLVGFMLLIFSVFALSSCVSLRSELHVVMSVIISAWKRYSVRLCLQLFMRCSCLIYVIFVCLHDCDGVQHVWYCVFVSFFLRLVYPMLSVSLDCPFMIGPSVFSDV